MIKNRRLDSMLSRLGTNLLRDKDRNICLSTTVLELIVHYGLCEPSANSDMTEATPVQMEPSHETSIPQA